MKKYEYLNGLIENMSKIDLSKHESNLYQDAQKWISKKQVGFISNIASENTYETFVSHGNTIKFETDKYMVKITVSPLNGAGTINATNKVKLTESFNKEIELEKTRKEFKKLLHDMDDLIDNQGQDEQTILNKLDELEKKIKELEASI